MSDPQRTLVVTAGDPCGIGPEVTVKALTPPLPKEIRLVIVGDLAVFEQTAQRCGTRLPRWTARLQFIDLAHRARFRPGRPGAASGRASWDYLEAAVDLVRRGLAGGLVTAPVTKWAIERAGHPFPGHTEYLAKALGGVEPLDFRSGLDPERSRRVEPVMMFVSPRLRVVLLTRHVAIRDVPRKVSPRLLRHTIRTTADGLRRYFGIRHPRLALCGLNPHAGEAGMFGQEEQRLFAPLLREFVRNGIRVDGPLSADAFFVNPSGVDAVVCWYHDQGLIPFKMLARDQGCQLTLGLPIVRTSPDHGSAPDIAGKNRAHPGSMRYALELAAKLVARRGQTPIATRTVSEGV